MSNIDKRGPISKEKLHKYITYIITGYLKDEEHIKEIQEISRTVATMSDITVVHKVLGAQQDKIIDQLITALQVQQRVLEKMGASEEMFKQAQKEHEEEYKAMEAELQKELETQNEETDKVTQLKPKKAKKQ